MNTGRILVMPNRIIKESIRTSRNVNTLSDFNFRVWVYLITYADDAGRGSADPELLKGMVFPRRKGITESQIQKALTELANMGMVILYEVDGEPYFYFPHWASHQRIRDCKPKFPDPPSSEDERSETICGELRQSAASCGELRQSAAIIQSNPIQSESESEYKSESEVIPPSPLTDEPDLSGMGTELQENVRDWLAYKKSRKQKYEPIGLDRLLKKIRRYAQKYGDAAVCGIISDSMASNYQGITFDRLDQQKGNGRGNGRDRRTANYDYSQDESDF